MIHVVMVLIDVNNVYEYTWLWDIDNNIDMYESPYQYHDQSMSN